MSHEVITPQEFILLKQVLQVTEEGLLQTLRQAMKKYYSEDKIYASADYIYAVGDLPIALVAHLDTVHPKPPIDIFHDTAKGLLWSPDGLGADDRAGVFAILHILNDGYRPSVIFTTGEERGGLGAISLVNDIPCPATNINFMIELDRQGANDAVYYECGNADFERFISTFGFHTELGSFSDISIIAPKWDVAAVNLSVGYYDEHSLIERLFYRELLRTIERVEQILESPLVDTKYNFLRMVEPISSDLFNCDACGRFFPSDSRTIVYDGEDEPFLMCPECAEHHATFCEKCGKPFLNICHQSKNTKCVNCGGKGVVPEWAWI